MTTDRQRLREEHPEDEFTAEVGRQFPYSQPGDWVLLADVPHGPKALYVALYGHVNIGKHGHSRVWPTEESLAAILGCTEKTIRKWIVELEKLGAIDVAEVIDPSTGHKRLIYTVHQAAPPGYTGCVDYTSWYKLRKTIKDGLTDSLADVAADDDACTPRKPPVKSTGGNGVKSTGGSDQGEQEPPVKSTGGQGSKSTAGQGAKTTGKEEQPKESNPRRPTTGAAEAPAVDNPEPSGGGLSQETKDQIVVVLRENLVDRATASLDNDDTKKTRTAKKAIITLAEECVVAGATIDELDAALSANIDHKTERPLFHGSEGLSALLARKQRGTDPLLGPATPSPWIAEDGFAYPANRPDQRACKGSACHDISGKKYVSIDHPELGAFSCPICKDHYRKETAAA